MVNAKAVHKSWAGAAQKQAGLQQSFISLSLIAAKLHFRFVRQKKFEQQQRRLEREEKQKREEQCETITSEEEAEIDEQLEIQKKAKRLE